MKLSILDLSWDMQTHEFSLELLLLRIEEAMKDTDLHFSHLIVDHDEVYGDYEEYFESNAAQMNEVRVVMKTTSELTADILLSIRDYMHRAIEELPHLSKQFHQGPTDETWSNYSSLMEGLQWLFAVFQQTREAALELGVDISGYWSQLEGTVTQLGEALEYKDVILLGDILLYELSPIFKDCADHIHNNVKAEVIKHDLN